MRLHDSAYAGVAVSVGLGASGVAAIFCFIAALVIPIVARCRHDRARLRAQNNQKLQNQEAPPISGCVDYMANGANDSPNELGKQNEGGGEADGTSSSAAWPKPPSSSYSYLTTPIRYTSAAALAIGTAFVLLFFAVLSGFAVIPPAVAVIVGLLLSAVPLCLSFWVMYACGLQKPSSATTQLTRSTADGGAFSPPATPAENGNAPASNPVEGVNFSDIIATRGGGGGGAIGSGDVSAAESDTSNSTLRRRSPNNAGERNGVGFSEDATQQQNQRGGGGGLEKSFGRSRSALSSLVSRVRRELNLFLSAVRTRRCLFFGLWLTPFALFAFLMFFLLWDVCFCATPFQMSSFISRAGKRFTYCPANQHCHFYPMMGMSSSVVRLVGHVKLDGGRRTVEAAWVDMCEVAAPLPGTTFPHVNAFDYSEEQLLSNNLEKFVAVDKQINALPCLAAPRVVRSSLIDYTAGGTGGEDMRYISHTYLDGLDPLKFYKVQSHFVFEGSAALLSKKQGEAARGESSKLFPSSLEEYGAQQTSRSIVFRTLPSPNDVTTSVNFISGGDYGTRDGKGKALMRVLYGEEPDVHFIHIGGDISYSNNMRSCYLRVDKTLLELTSFRTKAHGAAVPLHVLVGNHETGGYERVANRWDRLYFQQQYFPIFDRDTSFETVAAGGSPLMPHETFHKHVVSGLLGLVSLDSGCQIHPRKQVPYLNESLSYMHNGWAPSSAGSSLPPPTASDGLARFVVVTYHNPAFPSLRKFSDPQASAVRESFLPLIERYKVPLVLEFHDHVYKRTHPIHVAPNGELSIDVEEDRKAVDYAYKGTVYIGDGGIGLDRKTPGFRDPASARFQTAFAEASNLQLIRVNKSRVAEVLTYTNGDRKIIDTVRVGLRSG